MCLGCLLLVKELPVLSSYRGKHGKGVIKFVCGVKGMCRAVGYLQTCHMEGPAPAGLKFTDATGATDYLDSGAPPGAR